MGRELAFTQMGVPSSIVLPDGETGTCNIFAASPRGLGEAQLSRVE